MSGRTNFEKLRVYQFSESLADAIWKVVRRWDNLARDTVGKQLIRSADGAGCVRWCWEWYPIGPQPRLGDEVHAEIWRVAIAGEERPSSVKCLFGGNCGHDGAHRFFSLSFILPAAEFREVCRTKNKNPCFGSMHWGKSFRGRTGQQLDLGERAGKRRTLRHQVE